MHGEYFSITLGLDPPAEVIADGIEDGAKDVAAGLTLQFKCELYSFGAGGLGTSFFTEGSIIFFAITSSSITGYNILLLETVLLILPTDFNSFVSISF